MSEFNHNRLLWLTCSFCSQWIGSPLINYSVGSRILDMLKSAVIFLKIEKWSLILPYFLRHSFRCPVQIMQIKVCLTFSNFAEATCEHSWQRAALNDMWEWHSRKVCQDEWGNGQKRQLSPQEEFENGKHLRKDLC